MSDERLVPIGTPVVLKQPMTERDIGCVEPCSYTLGRVAEHEQGDRPYGIQFEGLTTQAGTLMTCYFKRDEFVLARAGT